MTTILGPTPERLQAANDNFVIDPTTQAYHFKDAPIERLLRSKSITTGQAEAGRRFYADYYMAGLAPLGAQDYGKPIVDGTSPMGHSDRRHSAVDRYNLACKAITFGNGQTLKVVDRVVLREMSVESAGRDVSGRKDDKQGRAVGMDRLIEGLDMLEKHYGLISRAVA
jgi:hypothetical protein